jgi:hypothetical protein
LAQRSRRNAVQELSQREVVKYFIELISENPENLDEFLIDSVEADELTAAFAIGSELLKDRSEDHFVRILNDEGEVVAKFGNEKGLVSAR